MKCSVQVRCIVCHLIFCCDKCRWNHEQEAHGLQYDCPICRGNRFLCQPQHLNQHFLEHIAEEHLPLQCRKCDQIFTNMDDLSNINKCVSISELIQADTKDLKDVEEKFDTLYEITNENEGILIDKCTKTAVITPIFRRKYLVDYECSESEDDSVRHEVIVPKLVPKTPKLKKQRAATPHVKKLLNLMRQKVVEEYEETVDDANFEDSPDKTTPSRNEDEAVPVPKEMTTPTSHLPYLAKLAQVVTTSTPTHPATGAWSLFPEQGADSPLSEIENSESPAQSIDNDPSKSESENVQRKLKSIIVTGSRSKLGSQDSSEKQVTFQDSVNTEASSVRIKRVKFAEDTVFEQETKVKRVYRKPKRMLTPGPRKPKFACNPRFQALINRFEHQGLTLVRTPVHTRSKTPETTPQVGEPSMHARAINFRDDSPVVEPNYSKESNDLFKTCVDSPEAGVNYAISAFTANVAGSLQNCLTSVLKTSEEETEIQFKFVITKRKVAVKKIVEDEVEVKPKAIEMCDNKENIWSTVVNSVRNVLWATTPQQPNESNDTTSSSASKRKFEDVSDTELSPLNHKRHKYEGRIRGRPPLRRCKTWVSGLRSSQSAEQHTLMDKVALVQDETNQSF